MSYNIWKWVIQRLSVVYGIYNGSESQYGGGSICVRMLEGGNRILCNRNSGGVGWMVWKCLFFWKSSPKKYANFHTIFGFVGFCRSYCGSCGLIYFKKPNLCRRFCEVINGQDQLGHFNGYNIRIISLSVISVQTHLSNKPPQNQTSLIAIWRTRQDSYEVGST